MNQGKYLSENILIDLPLWVQEVLFRLNSSGFKAYCVGGCVRDKLLGIPPTDWDICTSATPAEILTCFQGFTCKEIGQKYGTITIVISGKIIEVTTFRAEADYSDARHPDKVFFSKHLSVDLSRRDFTINALAYHPDTGVIDLHGGLADLSCRKIRSVGDPDLRFTEDPLRILRGLRFTAILVSPNVNQINVPPFPINSFFEDYDTVQDCESISAKEDMMTQTVFELYAPNFEGKSFDLESETSNSIFKNACKLTSVSKERIRDEFSKMLCGSNIQKVLTEYFDVFVTIFPEFKNSKNIFHNKSTIWTIGAAAIGTAQSSLTTRLAILVRQSQLQPENQTPIFTNDLAMAFLSTLRFSKKITQTVLMLAFSDAEIEPVRQKERYDIKKLIAKFGYSFLIEWCLMRIAEEYVQCEYFRVPVQNQPSHSVQGETSLPTNPEPLLEHANFLEKINGLRDENACCFRQDLAINGHDLIALGFSGVNLKVTLNSLLDLVMRDSISNKKPDLLKTATQITKNQPIVN